ncbi:MAG TPA: TAXI family TRAP transporter solute-binding subunit [Candidatus Lustribacter sp.]|nr:TAXI family TRAP transporter solute-binding subunit [Candidatus Lustribacter sp.]
MAARVIPPTTRSLLVLEMAAELTARAPARAPVRQATATVDLGGGHEIALFGSSTVAGIEAVATREVALAIVNPSAALTLAYRGTGPFEAPLPLRTLAVIPSRDQYVFAVNPRTGLRTFADIAVKRPALRIGVRGDRSHSLHFMLDDVMNAAGFSREDIVAWGGEFHYEGHAPDPESPKFRAFADGSLDAIFEEGADSWIGAAIDAGMTILSLSEPALVELERRGYRRADIPQTRYPHLAGDVHTVDFSGWPLFVHAEAPDDDVTRICAALAACVERIPWQEDGPLTLSRMCANAADAPYDVPLHPAAERSWRERGLL